MIETEDDNEDYVPAVPTVSLEEETDGEEEQRDDEQKEGENSDPDDGQDGPADGVSGGDVTTRGRHCRAARIVLDPFAIAPPEFGIGTDKNGTPVSVALVPDILSDKLSAAGSSAAEDVQTPAAAAGQQSAPAEDHPKKRHPGPESPEKSAHKKAKADQLPVAVALQTSTPPTSDGPIAVDVDSAVDERTAPSSPPSWASRLSHPNCPVADVTLDASGTRFMCPCSPENKRACPGGLGAIIAHR